MERKKLYSILGVSLVLIAVVVYLTLFNGNFSLKANSNDYENNDKVETVFDIEKIKFAKWDADVRLNEKTSTETINLIFVSPASYIEEIQAIDIEEIDNISIKDYKFEKGDQVKEGLHLNNLLLTITSDSPENIKKPVIIDTLTLINKDNEKHDIPIGKIRVGYDSDSDHLQIHKDYGLSYENFKFRATVKNVSDESIFIQSIDVDNDQIKFKNLTMNDVKSNKEIEVPAGETVEIDALFNLPEDGLNYNFYAISPTITYEANNEEKQFTLDTAFYEILKIDDEKIDDIINEKN